MQNQLHPLLLGAHISIADGLEHAIIRGESIGCTTIQIFTKSNRQWATKPIDPHTSTTFKSMLQHSRIKVVVAHAAYLINIASSNSYIRNKSLTALIDELERCHLLGIPYLVLHPGTQGENHEYECLTQIARQLDTALTLAQSTTMILLETMAGQGSSVCSTFEHLAQIYEQLTHQERIGICVDTCHIFAAGYDIRTKSTYDQTWQAFSSILGIDLLKVIHVNDSKKSLGSNVDRHEHIGKGLLTENAFQFLMNDPRFFNIPKIIETPKESLRDDWENMRTLVNLITPTNKKFMNIEIPDKFVEAKSK